MSKHSKKEEAERRRQEEREETFEAWLSKKREREIGLKEEAIRREEMELLRLQQKQARGRAAFDDWMQVKREQWKVEMKEKHRQKEIDAFEEERKKEQVQQSKEAYDQWKAQKDFEMRLQKQSEALDRQRQRESTPAVPGYCSVWCCDEELGPFIVQRVQRPNSPFVLPDDYPRVDST